MNLSGSPRVCTLSGTVEGFLTGPIAVFKGIPYASPQVAELRWQRPHPVEPWEGIRPAVSYGANAPQNSGRADRFKEFAVAGPQAEDCLYLNIWTPGLDTEKRPVMVWIHGGLFVMGSGAQSVFEGTNLAKSQDVVVVTLNYRLGLLGFMNLNVLTEGRIPSSGCEGLLDQIAALKWIKNNIARFGGNPDNITLFGESAGGASIECLMVMPEARGLFHKAIMQSSIHRFIPLTDAVDYTSLVLQELGIRPDDKKALLNCPLVNLLVVQSKLHSGRKRRSYTIAPVIDGVNLPVHPLVSFQSGQDMDIPLLAGTNLEETRLFQALRPDKKIDEILVATQTDFYFRLPMRDLLEARKRPHQKTWAYLFSWKSPVLRGLLGACHGMEIGFIFGNHDASFCGTGPEADALSHRIQTAWATFARTGNPACPDLANWPPYWPERYVRDIR
ncbi:MAG TPA: carboxylesterase/lipase family protein [Dehalococcoidales bacterium]|nr:carboxylesterase/lipase family protein [Dehalococcoidales bacterium]